MCVRTRVCILIPCTRKRARCVHVRICMHLYMRTRICMHTVILRMRTAHGALVYAYASVFAQIQ